MDMLVETQLLNIWCLTFHLDENAGHLHENQKRILL
jgi:hypothetical protein